MNATIKILGAFCILLLVQAVQAQTKTNSIDRFLEDCLSHIEGKTDEGSAGCLRVAREKWEQEVEKSYEQLMASSSDRDKQLIKAMHTSWLKYKEQHFKFLEDMYGERTGDWRIMLEEEKMKVVKYYALRLDVIESVSVYHLGATAK